MYDLNEAKGFYQRVFGLPIFFEDNNSAVFPFGETSLILLEVSHAGELVAPAAAAHQNAGVGLVLALGVENVDAKCAELAAQGVSLLNGPINRPWEVRTARFCDPAGYLWEIAGKIPG